MAGRPTLCLFGMLSSALIAAAEQPIELATPGAIPRRETRQADVASLLDSAASRLPQGLREILAAKPSPYLVKVHDVGAPTDFDTDIPWHALEKEKDPRFNLPHDGEMGLVNTNTDVNFILGLAVDSETGDHPRAVRVDFNPPRRTTDHLVNLVAQQVQLAGLDARVLFLPVLSDTLLAVIQLRTPEKQSKVVQVAAVCAKSPNGDEPFDRYGYGIHVTTGGLQWIGYNPANAALISSYEEWTRDRDQHRAGSLLCTMVGSEPPSSWDSSRSPERAEARLGFRLPLPAEGSRILLIALNLHRYGAERFESPRQIVLYPRQTPDEAREHSVRAAVESLAADWPSLLHDSFEWYARMPVFRMLEPSWSGDLACAMELPRGNTWSAQGQLRQPWYTFCRVHGHNPYGWWSYGMHAHEHLSTFVVNLTEPALSQSYLRGHLQAITPDGFIRYGVNHTTHDVHPGLATCPLLMWEAWTAYCWSGDRSFLEEAYAAGSRYLRWWRSDERTRAGTMLQHWKDYLETVRDDRDLATWKATGKAEQQEALDLNCYLLSEERALASIAHELGHQNEANDWTADADRRQDEMRRQLWNAQDRVYYGRDLTGGRWARVMDVSTFFPLWSGLASEEQARDIVALLKDPQAFGTDYPVATLAVRHMPEKRRGVYHWRGSNWVEMTWLVIQGLKRYGYNDEAARLAEINCRMVFKTLESSGHFREFYNSLTGEPSDLTDYIWASMPAIMATEIFFGVRPTGEGLEVLPTLPAGWREIAVENLHLRGSTLSIRIRRDSGVRRTTAIVNNEATPLYKNRGLLLRWNELPATCAIEITQPQ